MEQNDSCGLVDLILLLGFWGIVGCYTGNSPGRQVDIAVCLLSAARYIYNWLFYL